MFRHSFLHPLGIYIYIYIFFFLIRPYYYYYCSPKLLDRQKGLWFWYPCMEINVSVQYNEGLLPDIILLTRCGYIGEPFDTMKRFCLYRQCSHLSL